MAWMRWTMSPSGPEVDKVAAIRAKDRGSEQQAEKRNERQQTKPISYPSRL